MVGRDRVEQRGDLGTARVGRDMREVVAEAGKAAGTQPLVKARQHERALPRVQRDAGAIIDEANDAREIGVGESNVLAGDGVRPLHM